MFIKVVARDFSVESAIPANLDRDQQILIGYGLLFQEGYVLSEEWKIYLVIGGVEERLLQANP